MNSFLHTMALSALFFSGCAAHQDRVDPPTRYAPAAEDPEPNASSEQTASQEPFGVRSPFGKHRLMNVTGMAPGTEVQDPYTGGIFRVPASKDEEPAIVSEPPADWKPEN